jgi:YgiT-type zinc finger domain-containing protein
MEEDAKYARAISDSFLAKSGRDEKMMPFEKCPLCGGDLVEKEVETVLRGGVNTAILKVCAEVYLRCGERLHSQDTVRRFEQTRAKLERQDTKDFRAIGVSYQVA